MGSDLSYGKNIEKAFEQKVNRKFCKISNQILKDATRSFLFQNQQFQVASNFK